MDNKWERLEPTFSLEDERLDSLKQIVPEAFTDGKVDFDALRELLGDVVEDESAEHFGLNWTGKREARRLAGMPSKGTLVPVPGKGLHEDTTENIFIEGDNLEVLKLLHKSYRGKIKMIYIDPPYNTGNDFIYKDDYRMPLESYLQRSGQKSDMGELLTSNPKSSGRFHSDWLNMMYPRLRVAKDLLREDGVIFVSIDDNEVHNLKSVLNEIFGEENFIGELVWKKKYIGGKHARHFVDFHEYVLVFAKSIDDVGEFLMDRPEAELEKFDLEDDYIETRGKHYIRPLKSNLGRRETLIYPITLPDGDVIKTQWMVAPATFEELKKDGRIIFKQRNDGSYNVYRKYYEKDRGGNVKIPSLIDDVYNADGKVEIKTLFGIAEGRDIPFDNPKPTGLIRHFITPSTKEGEIVLDFFAGSGTTADALWRQCTDDGQTRRFICVQLDETTADGSPARQSGFKSIAEITLDRLNRASEQLNSGGGTLLPQSSDLGFSVFRLDSSNFKAWSDYQGNDLDELRGLLQSQLDSTFVEGATEDAIITEIILLEGFPLTSKIQIDETFQKNAVRRISHEWCEHKLFVTLDNEIQEETIRTVDQMIDSDEMSKIDIFICLDNALTDQDKLRLADVCRLKTI